MDSRVFLLAFFWTWQLFTTTANGHRFKQISSCTCLGYQIEYNCTTFGRGSTVWDGSAFDCPLNEILLRHSQFPGGDLRGVCNAGDICAHAINTGESDTFISKLVANVTSYLVNKTIRCSYDDGSTQHLVNSSVVRLTTDPFPPPIDVKLSSAGESHLNFSWSDAVRPSCPTLYYKINTTNCGACPTITNKTDIQCTGFEVSTEKQVCKLSVQTVVCDNLTGLRSNEINVMLQLSDTPDSIITVPQYNRNGKLQKLHTSVGISPGFSVFGNISGSPVSYTFNYFNAATNLSCGSSTASCSSGKCTDIFDFQSSRCSTNPDVSVNAYTTNLFGNSPVSSTTTTRATNILMNISVHNNMITCQFYGFYAIGTTSCNVVNITNEDCEEPLRWSIVSEELTHNLTTVVLNLPPNLSAYCLTLTVSNGSDTAVIKDTFVIDRGSSGGNSMAVVTVPLIVFVLIFVGMLLAAIFLYLLWKMGSPNKRNFTRVSFKPSDEELELTYCELKKMNPIDSEDQVEVVETKKESNEPPPSYYAISFYNPIED